MSGHTCRFRWTVQDLEVFLVLVLLGPQSDTIWQVAHSLGNIYYSETRELKAVLARGVASL